MKPLLLASLCLSLFFFNSRAQIGKGQIMLGGTASLSAKKNRPNDQTEQKITNYAISPELGFGVGKNWLLGASLGYAHAKTEVTTTTTGESVSDTYSGGVFVRKFHPFSDKFGLYAQANAEYGFGKGRNKYTGNFPDPVTYDITQLDVNVQPGLYFNPGKKIILEATFGILGYSKTKYDFKPTAIFSDNETKGFDFSVSDGLSLGFKIIL